MPNVDAANISYNLLRIAAGSGITVGGILLGAARPVHILTPSSTVRRIVNMTALAVVDANSQRAAAPADRLKRMNESAPAQRSAAPPRPRASRSRSSRAPALPKPEWIRVRVSQSERFREVKHAAARGAAAHRVRGSLVPEHRRMLRQGHRHLHGAGRPLHATLPVLRRRPRPAVAARPAGSRSTWPTPSPGCGLSYVVITSVDRDDLRDGGAAHFAACIRAVRERSPGTRIEVLTPDFRGRAEVALEILGADPPDVMNHNLETVPRLYRQARPGADYAHSLQLLQSFRQRRPDVPTKSGLMLGLGETDDEVLAVMRDLRRHGVDMLTVGQYLQPRPGNLLGAALRGAAAVRGARSAGASDGLRPCRLWSAGALELPRRPASPRGRRLRPASQFPGDTMDKNPTPRPLYKSLYFQVITAIVIGVLLGHFYPQTGEAMKPLGDGFIKLIKMIIAPIIFCTVVVGIAGMEDMKKVGKTGGLALLYFEIVSTHRADRRPGDRQRRPARRRHEHRPGDARHQGDRGLHRARARCRARSTSC